MDQITKLYKNKFLILQERYSALQEEYDILVENEKVNGWVKITVPGPNGKPISAWHNTDTGEYKFDDADVEPITPPSETLMGKIEGIPVAGPLLGAAIKTAKEQPVLAGTVTLGAGIGGVVLANNRLKKLEDQRAAAIELGKKIASEKSTDVPGIRDSVHSEFKTVKGEKPISTARSVFGVAPERDVRPSSRVYREFNPTLSPTVISTPGVMRGPTQTTIPNYSSPDLPGETFKLDKRTGEMVPNQTWTSGRQNAPRFKALETLGKVVGVPTLALGAYGAAEDIAAGEVPSVGDVAQLGAGTAMVAPKTTGKAIESALTKIAPGVATKIGLKKIPLGIGALVGLGLAAERASAGDWIGAAGEAASGIAGTVPGLGTAVSAGIDAALLARDLSDTTEDEEKKKQEILKLQMGNATKPSEVKVVGPKM